MAPELSDQQILEKCFEAWNAALFGGSLRTPELVAGELAPGVGGLFGSRGPRITVDAGELGGSRGERVARIASTTLHEMVHQWQDEAGQVGTDDAGIVHLRTYRRAAMDHGLECEWRQGHGWDVTRPTAEAWLALMDAADPELERALVAGALEALGRSWDAGGPAM